MGGGSSVFFGTPWGAKCPLTGRSEPACVSIGIPGDFKFLIASGGLHNYSLLEPVDGMKERGKIAT